MGIDSSLCGCPYVVISILNSHICDTFNVLSNVAYYISLRGVCDCSQTVSPSVKFMYQERVETTSLGYDRSKLLEQNV